MKVKFVIPVMDTESGKYEYNGRAFSNDEYFRMIQNRTIQTRKAMDEFAFNYGHGLNINRGTSSNRLLYDIENVKNKEIDYVFSESEALILDGDDDEITIDTLNEYLTNGKKFLLKVNINPNSLDGDAESELRNWMDDSNKVLSDKLLDERTMLLSLPLRDFILDTDFDGNNDKLPIFHILGCKIIQIYTKKQSGFDYYFAIMCEQIKKQ